MHAGDGSFHVKAGFLTLDRPYFAATLNANFPQNGARHGLPTIQGAVILSDAGNGLRLPSWIRCPLLHCARQRRTDAGSVTVPIPAHRELRALAGHPLDCGASAE